jgi:hypothetical protein
VGFEPTVGLHLLRFSRPSGDSRKSNSGKDSGLASPEVAPLLVHDECTMTADLAEVVAAWPGLDETTRSEVMSMVRRRRMGID